MSRSGFSTANYLTAGAAPVTAAPLTIAAFVNISTVGTGEIAASLGTSGSNNNRFTLQITAGGLVQMTSRASDGTQASASHASGVIGTVPAGTWSHWCGVVRGDADRSAYLNGGGRGNNTTSKPVGTPDELRVGLSNNNTALPGTHLSIAHLAVWNIDLTDDEIALIGAGVSPQLVRPQNLVFYSPTMGRDADDIDIIGGNDLVQTGTVAASDDDPVVHRATTKRRNVYVPAVSSPDITATVNKTLRKATLDTTVSISGTPPLDPITAQVGGTATGGVARQYHAGHWAQLQVGGRTRSIMDGMLAAAPTIKGFLARFYWYEIESDPDVYDFTEVLDRLAYCRDNGIKFMVTFFDKSFGNDVSNGRNPMPDYMSAYTMVTNGLSGQAGQCSIRWHSFVVERYKALHTAFYNAVVAADALDPGLLDTFHGIGLPETALSVSSSITNANGYSPEIYGAYYIDFYQFLSELMPAQRAFWWVNFIQGGLGQVDVVINACKNLGGFTFGGPDCWPWSTSLNSGVYTKYETHKDDCPISIGMSPDAYTDAPAGSQWEDMQNVFEFARDTLHVNYIFWMNMNSSPNHNDFYNEGAAVIAANQTFNDETSTWADNSSSPGGAYRLGDVTLDATLDSGFNATVDATLRRATLTTTVQVVPQDPPFAVLSQELQALALTSTAEVVVGATVDGTLDEVVLSTDVRSLAPITATIADGEVVLDDVQLTTSGGPLVQAQVSAALDDVTLSTVEQAEEPTPSTAGGRISRGSASKIGKKYARDFYRVLYESNSKPSARERAITTEVMSDQARQSIVAEMGARNAMIAERLFASGNLPVPGGLIEAFAPLVWEPVSASVTAPLGSLTLVSYAYWNWDDVIAADDEWILEHA